LCTSGVVTEVFSGPESTPEVGGENQKETMIEKMKFKDKKIDKEGEGEEEKQ
jgi:hypothetical protein